MAPSCYSARVRWWSWAAPKPSGGFAGLTQCGHRLAAARRVGCPLGNRAGPALGGSCVFRLASVRGRGAVPLNGRGWLRAGCGRWLWHREAFNGPVEPVAQGARDLGVSTGPPVELMMCRVSNSAGSPHRAAPSLSRYAGQSRNMAWLFIASSFGLREERRRAAGAGAGSVTSTPAPAVVAHRRHNGRWIASSRSGGRRLGSAAGWRRGGEGTIRRCFLRRRSPR